MNRKNDEAKASSRKMWIKFIALILAVCIPLTVCLVAVFFCPDVYSETFLGGLSLKYERLLQTNEKKIVVVGGSSVAFGLDSALLAEHTGYEVVNFGLYATLGTKLMLDLSKANINEGDIVIIAPEMDKQTLSMYFNAEATWQALESDLSMIFHVGSDNVGDLLGGMLEYAAEKYLYAFSGKKLKVNGIYRVDSFNIYGDIAKEKYPREYNDMEMGYDVNQTITLKADIFDAEFVAYLNEYAAWVKERGATPYFAFCPMNVAALEEGTDQASLGRFYSDVVDMLDFTVIGSPASSLFHQNYFYDTNYHLNDAGVVLHTVRMIEDLFSVWNRTDLPQIELPAAPARPGTTDKAEHWVDNEWSKYFIYEPFGEDALKIVGVTPAGKHKSTLEIPYTADGKVVRVVDKNAFEGCRVLTDLYIHDNISLLINGAFSGCEKLQNIHIMRDDEENLEANEGLFEGADSGVKILFHTEEAYSNFVSGYWWAHHAERMEMAPIA